MPLNCEDNITDDRRQNRKVSNEFAVLSFFKALNFFLITDLSYLPTDFNKSAHNKKLHQNDAVFDF